MEGFIEIDHEVMAGKGARLLNLFIDGIICTTLTGVVYLIMLLLYKFADMQGLMLWYMEMGAFTKLVISAGVTTFYYLVFETFTGRTLGKLATNTRVVDALGNRPQAKAILIRTLVRLMPLEAFTFIGEFAIGLHDSASKTYVIDTHKYNRAMHLKKAYDALGVENDPRRMFDN